MNSFKCNQVCLHSYVKSGSREREIQTFIRVYHGPMEGFIKREFWVVKRLVEIKLNNKDTSCC